MAQIILIAILVVFACVASAAKKKKKAAENSTIKRMSEHEVSTPAFSRETKVDVPVRCTCATGRQRYLDQAEMFYKNGLIDKAEYNSMRERYEKLDIPDDF